MCVCLQLGAAVCLYMYDVCMEVIICTLVPLFVYVMKLCVLSYYIVYIISSYPKTMETSIKMFSNKNHASSTGEKSTDARGLTSNIPTSGTVQFYNPTLL